MASLSLPLFVIGFTLINFVVIWLILFLFFCACGRIIAGPSAGINVRPTDAAIVALIEAVVYIGTQSIFKWVFGLLSPNLIVPIGFQLVGIVLSGLLALIPFNILAEYVFFMTSSHKMIISLIILLCISLASLSLIALEYLFLSYFLNI